MADRTLGYCFWPGVRQVMTASMTMTQGVRPSVCQMDLLPQVAEGIAEFGTLTWVWGDVKIQFPNCKVDKGSFRYDSSGMVVSLSILDRRWKWQFCPPVSVTYNRRTPNIGTFGSIDATTAAAPRDIATALLKAMGETGYDVSQLPNDARPELLYDWDNAAEKLNDLAESLGCRVVLTLDDLAKVVRQGTGGPLPAGDEMRLQQVLDPPEIPDTITVVGGRSEFQVDLPLQAVGQDTDGTIKPIAQLSYTPAGGWGAYADVGWWSAVPGYLLLNAGIPQALLKAQTLGWAVPNALARQTVYKWYRVAMTDLANAKLPPLIPGWEPGTNEEQYGTRLKAGALYQILPLLGKQAQGWYDPLNANAFNPFDPYVYGQFYSYGGGGFVGGIITQEDANGNSAAGSLCWFDFQLDRERGIVQFSGDPVYLNSAAAGQVTAPAVLNLRVAVNVRDPTTEAWSRYSRTRQTGQSNNTGPRLVKRDEVIRLVVPKYDSNGNVTGLSTSQEENDREADYALDAAQAEYRTVQALDTTYMGLKAISCDGVITQVTWNVGPGGATTRASLGTEYHPVLPSYRERRLVQQMAAKAPVVQRLQDQQRRQ